jgi:hypothetical protein
VKGNAVNTNENATPGAERRKRVDLRDIFDDVLVRVAPFIQANGASLEYWAAHAVREAYPDLDEQGLQIIVAAAIRVCRERNATAAR